jgi:hypothetical protein
MLDTIFLGIITLLSFLSILAVNHISVNNRHQRDVILRKIDEVLNEVRETNMNTDKIEYFTQQIEENTREKLSLDD